MSMKEEKLSLEAVRTADGEVVVPASCKYKTVAQCRREQEAERAAEAQASGDDVAEELSMDKLWLCQKKEAGCQGETAFECKQQPDTKQQLKRQLTKTNKQLTDFDLQCEPPEENAEPKTQEEKVSLSTADQNQKKSTANPNEPADVDEVDEAENGTRVSPGPVPTEDPATAEA
ncbi:hypothetical protein PHMEG_00040998 [Phytophthora megakarya]|uniref:Uncharacterized protein n=1 Tax=Phytophthora megakarya TaxID=4795 RepID=A0A225UBZ7_9STRA|nr:hypothetical protein PHMEG_00040998 [Phytophthora megakarya]